MNVTNLPWSSFVTHPDLLGPSLPLDTWQAWIAIGKAVKKEALTSEELLLFKQFTGDRNLPEGSVDSTWLVKGRRAGGSQFLATWALYQALIPDWSKYVGRGEVPKVLCLSQDKSQAQILLSYITGQISASPLLSSCIVSDKVEVLTVQPPDRNYQVEICVKSASFRGLRGYALPCLLCDEVGWWLDENSRNPAEEILRAVTPGMASLPGSLMLCSSSPYSKQGPLWEAYKRYFGKDVDDTLVFQFASRDTNPTLSEAFIQRQYERDPDSASAEFGAQFRTDVGALVPPEIIGACTAGVTELPRPEHNEVVCFVDPSSGQSDSMTCSFVYWDDEKSKAVLLKTLEARAPFDPTEVVKWFSEEMTSWGVKWCAGDAYSVGYVVNLFKQYKIDYTVSSDNKSEIYLNLLPLLNAHKVQLLDDPRLITQLGNLERRVSRSGRDSVDHRPGTKDDRINSAAGALVLCYELHTEHVEDEDAVFV